MHQFVSGYVGIVDIGANAVAALAQVVRSHIRGHSHSNSGGTVEQHKWQFGRHYGRLLEGVVEVVLHIHGILLQVSENIL